MYKMIFNREISKITPSIKIIVTGFVLILLFIIAGCSNTQLNPEKVMIYNTAQNHFNSKSSTSRVKSLGMFVKVGDERSRNYLRKALKDKDVMVRSAAVDAIVNLDGVNSLDDLINSLSDNDRGIAEKASSYIKGFGSSSVSPLLKIFDKSDSKDHKLDTIKAMGIVADKSFIDLLGRIVVDSRDYKMRIEAIKALSNFENPVAESYIEAALNDRIIKVKEIALKSIHKTGNENFVRKMEPLLDNQNPRVVNLVIDALIENDHESAVYPLMRKLKTLETGNDMSDKISEAFARLGSMSTVNTFISSLNDSKQFVRYSILKAAIDAKEQPWSKEVISHATENNMPEIRNMAILALRNIETRDRSGKIFEALYDSDPKIRINAIKALANLPDAAGYKDEFVRKLRDDNYDVVLETIHVIPEVDSDWNLELLKTVLKKESDQRLLIAAAHSTGKLKNTTGAANTLAKLMTDEREALANAAANAINNLPKEYAVPEISVLLENESPEIRLRAVNTLAQLGDPDSKSLLQLMISDPDVRVRLAATKALDTINRKEELQNVINMPGIHMEKKQ